MSRLAKKQPARCTDLPLDNGDICNKLNILRELLKSCYGPKCRLKQIHNNVGGHVVTTSTASVLLPALSSSEPFINLIRTSILNHVSRFSDCGLFAAILCLSLLEQAEQSNLRRDVSIRVNNYLLGLCTGYLQQEDCGCKVKVDFSSSQALIRLALSVLSSKPACMFREVEALHISKLTVQGFLLTVPCNTPGVVKLGQIVTLTIEGLPVLDSAVHPGLLLDAPDLKHTEHLNVGAALRTVLFSESLAGDLSEFGDGIIEVHKGVDIDSQILDQLLKIGEQVVKDRVTIFMCQKVIHPILQQYLRDHGIIVIERLGINLMEPVIQLTGAQPVAALHATIPPKAYGKLKNVTMKQFGLKTLLHLLPPEESAICTMVLCHRNETMLNELKVACDKTGHVLRLTLRDPFALFGGGCTESHLAAYIRNKSQNMTPETASEVGCSQTEYHLAAEGFCRSLESVAAALVHSGGRSLIDLTHAHHWTLPADVAQDEMEHSLRVCGCGLVKQCMDFKWSFLKSKYPEFSPAALSGDADLKFCVLDSFTAKCNGLQVAVETANLALDVRYIIQDTN